MTVSLTPQEAASKIGQINDARDRAVQTLSRMSDTQQSMLGGGWHGGSATTYGKTSAQQHEDFSQLITTLNSVVEKGSQHIHSIANLDNS